LLELELGSSFFVADLDEKESFDCFGGGFVPLGWPKNLLMECMYQLSFRKLIWKSTHPKVVWESLTYPKVACLGGIVKTGLMIELLVAPDTVTSSLRKATVVEVIVKW
jgi:hypothetical protein